MFALQKIARRTPQLMKLTETQRRSKTLQATPPRVRVSFAEKMLLGAVFYVGLLATPVWVVLHVNEYNAHKHED
ncbi:hypothetical protein ANTQUA_LOCUS6046 [Anthophora quadrimaculata]